MSDRAIFLDKDGTLIEDLPYNVDPQRIRFAPGAREALPLFHAAGFRLVVITNQSGVARGYFTEADLARVADHLTAMLAEVGVPLAGFYACPHHPQGVNEYARVCGCRKPEPGLILDAARDLDIDLARSWFIGDTWYDVAAGLRAGCRAVQVGPEHRLAHTLPPDRRPHHAVANLAEAARAILAEEGTTPDATPAPAAVPDGTP